MSLKRLIEAWRDVPVSECRGCKKKIVWAETQDGKKIPLDPSPPVYMLMRFKDQNDKWVYRCDKGGTVFVSHWATCPEAYKAEGERAWEKPIKETP